MPPHYGAVRALLAAAAFTRHELDIICQHAFDRDLAAIMEQAAERTDPIDAIMEYAVRYGLVAAVAEYAIEGGAGRPAVQNLLLSDNMEQPAPQSQNGNYQYNLLRIEAKIDNLTERVSALTANSAEYERRLRSVERVAERPPLNWSVIMFAISIAVAVGFMTYTLAAR